MGDELAMGGFILDRVEVFAYLRHATWVANGKDGLCDLFRSQVEVIDGAAAVDDQFGFGDSLHLSNLAEISNADC